ncbi:DUF421 domain-containing protein [Bacillus anthracis]|uniref:DUF421 domain-containing protein n=1 Tax=Bacillus anthracis TaxID=1392 RepID=UPI000BF93DD8|nr:DUF421 domain-containing protein [Bacillus anthracis]PGB55776.1 DUF421 domain-containing protein [Bacillus anthracis]
MIDFLKEISLVLVRIITILPLLLFVTLFMGKRAIGELPIFDFLIIITLGAVVGADIADPSIKHLPTVITIIAIGILQKIVTSWKISNRKLDKLLTFEPTIVIQDGKLLDKNLKKIRYSIDNVLQMLREKNVFDINDVETAIIEANGALSVLKKPSKNTITLEDIKIQNKMSAISFPVILEGKVCLNILEKLHLNEDWLNQQLSDQGVNNINDIFFATVNYNLELYVSLRNEKNITIPPIVH